MDIVSKNNILGQKIWFKSEKRPYIIKAFSDRYVICTKPFNLKKTVLYTIIDWTRKVRGPNNLVFNLYDYTEQDDIENCMHDLIKNEIQVSFRHCIPLDVKKFGEISM